MYAPTHESLFFRLFPPPRFLTMPSVGVDISDHSVRFVELLGTPGAFKVGRFGRAPIADGVLSYGNIKQSRQLSDILRGVKDKHRLDFVRASLPEEKAYVFETMVPELSREETHENIAFQFEEHAPISATDALFDFVYLPKDPAHANKNERAVMVSAFPRAVVESYVAAYEDAGLKLLSIEMESDAIARSLVPRTDQGTYMLVDFGQQRTGLSIVSNNVVQFTSTVDVGGGLLTMAIQKNFSLSFEEAEQKKKEAIFNRERNRELFLLLMNSIAALKDEINKHYLYWHDHVVKEHPELAIQKILMCGGDANLPGLPEHLALTVGCPVELSNVWANAFNLDVYVPPITFNESLSYAAAIGLALRQG